MAAKVWTAFDQAFWPDADDPNIRVLKVTPGAAERWEIPASSSPSSTWRRAPSQASARPT